MKHSFVLFTGYNCNYNCSYCFQRNTRKIVEIENVNIINKKLLKTALKVVKLFNDEQLSKLYNNTVQIIGGEPTLYDLNNIVKILLTSKNIKNIRLFSNMSAPAIVYKKIINICKINNSKLVLSCSFHPEKVSLKEFSDKIKQIYINDDNIKIVPKLVVTNSYSIDFLNLFLKEFKNLNIKASILPEYSACTENNMNCNFECNLNNELFNFTLNNILKNVKNKNLVKQIIMSSRDKENRYLKEPITVIPNIFIDYNGKIFYPCKGCKEIKEDELTIDKLKVKCNDKNCMLYNECREVI